MRKLMLLSIFMILFVLQSFAQTYAGTCYTMNRDDNSDNIQVYNTDVVVEKNVITFANIAFFEYDTELGIYLGIPIDLLEKYDGRLMMQKTIELYILDGSPPILHVHNKSDKFIHFMFYLRGTNNERDFLIQTFYGKAKI